MPVIVQQIAFIVLAAARVASVIFAPAPALSAVGQFRLRRLRPGFVDSLRERVPDLTCADDR